MDLQTIVRGEHRRIDHAFSALLAGRTERSLVDLIEELTAYLATEQRVLAPIVERELDYAATAAVAETRSRMRILLLRLGAMYRLGASRLEETIVQLEAIMRRHLALEARTILPELERILSPEEATLVADAMQVEHDAVVSAFRQAVARNRSIGV